MKKLFMVCNAHIDPVWQWEWEEGVGAVLSTFRAAADFCEEYDSFVFNHNEVIVYKWVEEYEPTLFARIQKLVKEGRWHIMGGWYLQPDCNMPSGESFVRQIEAGRRYFKDKFDAVPNVAINFDPFGHSKGIVQIMQKAGFTGYVICRPTAPEMKIEDENFLWEGFNNSSITVHRSNGFYSSPMGKVNEKIGYYIKDFKEGPWAQKHSRMMLWGVGNHGGGPSRKDLDLISQMQKEQKDVELIHATPEQFFEAIKNDELIKVDTTLGRCNLGCYSSLVRLKQKHRLFENELLATEKINAHAAAQNLIEYPAAKIEAAQEDLLYAQFHDILPGSSVQPVEEMALRMMDHGLEELSRIKTRAFFALCEGEAAAVDKEYPILIYNPHPVEVDTIIETEFMLSDQNHGVNISYPTVFYKEAALPTQIEKETSNIPIDWRKKAVFRAKLAPMSVSRFQCFTNMIEKNEIPAIDYMLPAYTFDNSTMQVKFNVNTGLIDSYIVNGREFSTKGACEIMAMEDCEDSWGFFNFNCNTEKGRFTLVTEQEAAKVAAIKDESLKPLRIIEDGGVRMVIEGIYKYNLSFAIVRYYLPKQGSEISLKIRIINNERDTLFKLNIPTTIKGGQYVGKTAYGVDALLNDGGECVSQEWSMCFDDKFAVSCINNGTYSSSCNDGVMRPTLMRSCAYCAHPIEGKTILPQDRFSERAEQGERLFEYVINAGEKEEREEKIDLEAAIVNQKPFGMSFFPSGKGQKSGSFVELSNKAVSLTTIKQAKNGGYTLRLFNATQKLQSTHITFVQSGVKGNFALQPMEVLSLIYINGNFEKTELIDF